LEHNALRDRYTKNKKLIKGYIMIYETIDTAGQLRDRFVAYDRDYYSYDGYQAILDYFEDVGENYELDVIAICCDFTEADAATIRSAYSLDDDADVEEYLNENTWAVETAENTYLYISF
jgi:hypothetical protein